MLHLYLNLRVFVAAIVVLFSNFTFASGYLPERFVEGKKLLEIKYSFNKLPEQYKNVIEDLLGKEYPGFESARITNIGMPVGIPDHDQLDMPYVQHYFTALYDDVSVVVLKVPDEKISLFKEVPYGEEIHPRDMWDYLVLFIDPQLKKNKEVSFCGTRLDGKYFVIDSVQVLRQGLQNIPAEELEESICQYKG